MALTPGAKLGPYEILAPLGAGGMGEVYRARDSKLGRDVAIKVLPQSFASDAERMARFEREAKLLASLNHPNIASIYGFEDSNGSGALVMELVNGPTLAERLQQGGVPLEEVLPIAKQIAEGLEYAHERGIIHRDLKPANIKLSPDGAAKILDFGLAKAIEGDPTSTDISTSPTITRMATQAGIILGTAAYMSPEQAKGKPVDCRTDIWAFCCVLFEMLSGKSTFGGETVTDVLAAVVMRDPEWSSLPDSTPPRIRELLQRCLRRDKKQRLQSIGDARIILDETIAKAPDGSSSQSSQSSSRTVWLVALPLVFVALLTPVWSWLYFSHKAAPSPSSALSAILISAADLDDPRLSPDGNSVAYVSAGKLWIRNLSNIDPHPLEGTDGGQNPFWSPDSKSIAYFYGTEIRRISVLGGPSNLVCTLPAGKSLNEGTWGAEDRIVFSMLPTGLFEVSAQGGQPKVFAKADPAKDEYLLRGPKFLSDGKTLLMIVRRPGPGLHLDTIAIQSGQNRKVVLQIPGSALFTPVSAERSGHLLFDESRPNKGIWAVPFSFSKFQSTGQPFLIRAKARSASISLDGRMVYLSGDNPGASELSWVDRSGKVLGSFGSPKLDMRFPNISPKGNHVAVISVGDKVSVWVQDVIRNAATNLTASLYYAWAPAWSREGNAVVFSCQESSSSPKGLCIAPADGSGKPNLILAGPDAVSLTLSPDNSTALFSTHDEKGNYDIWSVSLREGAKAEPFLVTPANEDYPQFYRMVTTLRINRMSQGAMKFMSVPFLQAMGSGQFLPTGAIHPNGIPPATNFSLLKVRD
jgi:eukaryotic-like serine/threonine-protein kinase